MEPTTPPGYGGYLHAAGRTLPGTPALFDLIQIGIGTEVASPAYDRLFEKDISKGPRGTGQFTNSNQSFIAVDEVKGGVLESFEMVDPRNLVFTVRQGMHYHDKPGLPRSGEEMTRDDVIEVWNILGSDERCFCYGRHERVVFSPRGDWQIDVALQNPDTMGSWLLDIVTVNGFAPPEWFTDESIDRSDWRNVLGTGPFLVTDHLKGSVTTYARNPNYWENDPFMPENRLPYLDGYRYVVYADSAAKVAGFRTGQLDMNTHTGLSPKETASLKNTNPEIRSTPGFILAQFAPVRADEAPWSDIRVRQAAMLAINHEEVRDAFFGGAAGFPAFPIVESVPGHLDADGLQQVRPDLAELYGHDPDKARQLLADAGYPDGFKTQMTTNSIWQENSVLMVNYLAEVGIDVEINVMEPSAAGASVTSSSYTGMGFHDSGGTNIGLQSMFQHHMPRSPAAFMGDVSGPEVDKLYELWDAINLETDPDRFQELWQELYLHIMEQLWAIDLTGVHTSAHWQPWVKGMEGGTGYEIYRYNYIKYHWIDAAQKKELSGRGPND